MVVLLGLIVILIDCMMRAIASSQWAGHVLIWQIGGIGVGHYDHYVARDYGYSILADSALVIIAPLIVLAFMHRQQINDKLPVGGLIMMVAGGIANIIQLALWGYVTDWIYLDPPGMDHFPAIWNLADFMIYGGVAVLILSVLYQVIRPPAHLTTPIG